MENLDKIILLEDVEINRSFPMGETMRIRKPQIMKNIPVTKEPRTTYFVLPYYVMTFDKSNSYDIAGKAFKNLFEMDEQMPTELYKFRDETGNLYIWDNDNWIEIGKRYVVVRHNPEFNYPETIISENGIFKSIAEAEEYIEKNGGTWKLYSWDELMDKICESVRLQDKLEEEKSDNTECPFEMP